MVCCFPEMDGKLNTKWDAVILQLSIQLQKIYGLPSLNLNGTVCFFFFFFWRYGECEKRQQFSANEAINSTEDRKGQGAGTVDTGSSIYCSCSRQTTSTL